MSDSLTCGPIHHDVDVQMLTLVHIEGVPFPDTHWPVVNAYQSIFILFFSFCIHPKPHRLDLDGVHVECCRTGKNNASLWCPETPA